MPPLWLVRSANAAIRGPLPAAAPPSRNRSSLSSSLSKTRAPPAQTPVNRLAAPRPAATVVRPAPPSAVDPPTPSRLSSSRPSSSRTPVQLARAPASLPVAPLPAVTAARRVLPFVAALLLPTPSPSLLSSSQSRIPVPPVSPVVSLPAPPQETATASRLVPQSVEDQALLPILSLSS